jgi:spermidine synthase
MLRTGPQAPEEYIRWDPLARVELTPTSPPSLDNALYPSLLGEDRAFLARFEKILTQNNYAYAYAVHYDGRPESFAGVDQTLYSAAYALRAEPPARVVAIGVGGGFDILTALRYGAGQVTGVEVNATILRLLRQDRREYFRAWVDDPRVLLVNDEGRHFLAESAGGFDIIQLSGVDSYSGTPGAAHVFSENYLYTLEAFQVYLSRLADDGVLHMMRLEHKPAREMLRAVTTAVAALRSRGIDDPAAHIVTVTARRGNITSLLVKKRPFSPDELARIFAWSGRSAHFEVSAAPGRNAKVENTYQAFLEQGSAGREKAFAAEYPFDIAPTEDDRPFFFRFSRWWHLFPADPTIWATLPVMEMSLILLLGAVGLCALVVVGLPLRLLRRQGRPRGLVRYGFYFTCIGLGFMAIEMALLQRFGLLLGHPSYALSVVLASLLFGSGVGALYSAAILARLGGLRFAAYALCGLMLGQLLLLPRPAVLVTQPFALRVLLVVLLTAAAGALMGIFFPAGLDRLKSVSAAYVPWAWGLNGIASVLAPILSIGLAITFGNAFLLVIALPFYLLAGVLLPGERRAA